MIGSGLKKLALENGMKVSNGVAYGSLRGYAATLSEGAGYKQIVFSARFSDPVKKTEFLDMIGSIGNKQLNKDYRVTNLGINGSIIQVVFHDNPGTMKKILAFIDWFIPLLGEYGATGVNVCSECGCEIIDSGSWVMVDGACHHVHGACAERVEQGIQESNQQEKLQRTGSYASGALGAFLGAALGAVVWAIVLYAGYVASIVGLLIGWLANKGYDLLKGKQGKGKVVILILAIIFGVLLGTLAVDAVSLAQMIDMGQFPGFTYGDIPLMILALFAESPEYTSATLGNIGLGLLFAALGVFALLRKTGKEVADTKFVKLS